MTCTNRPLRVAAAESPKFCMTSSTSPAALNSAPTHFANAAGAYYAGGFEEGMMVSRDGAGDGHSWHVYEVTDGKWQYLHSVPSFDPVGDYSGYVTQISGFKAGKHEGKITRLVAYGKPAYREIFDRFIRYNEAGSSEVREIF